MAVERALVTGGAGFIWSSVVELLAGQGTAVLVVDDLSTGSATNTSTGGAIYGAAGAPGRRVAPHQRVDPCAVRCPSSARRAGAGRRAG
jgi:nucleoside-diphosphate-sugar epimerase